RRRRLRLRRQQQEQDPPGRRRRDEDAHQADRRRNDQGAGAVVPSAGDTGSATGRPALELRGITKHYGDCYANRGVDLSVRSQTIHAVVGENGAGKSTLMKVAYGHTRADAGEISIKGERIARHSVAQSIARGVGMVHQHFMLVGSLTVAENVILGREVRRGLLLDLGRACAEIRALSRKFGLDVDPTMLVEDLSVGQQQRVEIIKVLWRGCDV